MADVTTPAPSGSVSPTSIPPGGHPDLPPPATQVGAIGWARRNLFSSPTNTVLTLVALYLLYLIIPPVLNWAIFQANWGPGTSRAACVKPGACWTMIRARFGLLMYGFYPLDQRWRVDLTFILQFIPMAGPLVENEPRQRECAVFLFLVSP